MRNLEREQQDPNAGPRVLVIVKRVAGAGGLQIQARKVCAGLARRGLPVTVLAHQPTGCADLGPWLRDIPHRFLPGTGEWSFARAVYRELVNGAGDYDVVHVLGLGPEFLAACAARRRTGKPLIGQPCVAGPGSRLSLTRRMRRWVPPALDGVLSGLWAAPDHWVGISEQIRQELRAMAVPEERISAIGNGVNTDLFYTPAPAERLSLRGRFQLSEEETVFVTTSRLTPHKQVDLLIRAFARLAGAHPQARLWVIGGGEQRSELEALARSRHLDDRIRFLGVLPQAEVARRLQACDIFTLLSSREGLSCSVQEAMACGLPPVVSDVSGARELIAAGESGAIVPPGDEEAAVRTFDRLLRDRKLREKLGQAASERIRREYTLERTIDRFAELYARCAEHAEPGLASTDPFWGRLPVGRDEQRLARRETGTP